MFIIEEPYVSDVLSSAVQELALPVLDTPMARRTLPLPASRLLTDVAFTRLASHPDARLYTNSEHAISWIGRHLRETELFRQVRLFKDKLAFRGLLADLYPDYGYRAIDAGRLHAFDPCSLTTPFVVKPAVGFFSLGVHVVESHDEWPGVAAAIERELLCLGSMYPEDVLSLDRFVAEEVIPGREFAVDAYYDGAGQPTVINVYRHAFASSGDVSDRVYLTNVPIVEEDEPLALEFLREVGRRASLANFPVHVELRVSDEGAVAPIEVNPLRFGGWCAADIAHFAYGVDPYRCYFEGLRPDWQQIGMQTEGWTTALVIADLPPTTDLGAIRSVDYARFASRFSQVLELRPMDYSRYPVFAFTFVRVPTDDQSELDAILGEDLTTYLQRGD